MNLFNVGQKVALLFPKEDKLVEMVCEVAKVDYDRLELILPQYFMRYIQFLQVGSPLLARVFMPVGTIDFSTIVLTSPLEEVFSIELDYNSIKLASEDDSVSINAIEPLTISYKGQQINAKTYELSLSGIKFTSNDKFYPEEVMDCQLILPEKYGIINFKLIISEQNEEYENEYSADFYTITEQDRQTLLYYMYVYANSIEQDIE